MGQGVPCNVVVSELRVAVRRAAPVFSATANTRDFVR